MGNGTKIVMVNVTAEMTPAEITQLLSWSCVIAGYLSR